MLVAPVAEEVSMSGVVTRQLSVGVLHTTRHIFNYDMRPIEMISGLLSRHSVLRLNHLIS